MVTDKQFLFLTSNPHTTVDAKAPKKPSHVFLGDKLISLVRPKKKPKNTTRLIHYKKMGRTNQINMPLRHYRSPWKQVIKTRKDPRKYSEESNKVDYPKRTL